MNAMPAIRRTMGMVEWGLLIILSVIWGGSFFFNAVAVRDLPPLTVVIGRVAVGAGLLAVFVRLAGQPIPVAPAVWRSFLMMGLLNNALPFTLIVWGQTQIASGLAAILNATTPLFTALAAHAFTADEKLTAPRLAGVAAGFVGVAVLIGPEPWQGVGSNLLAQTACLGAAVSYALAGTFGQRFRRLGVGPLPAAAGQTMASTLLLLPLALLVDRPWTLPMPGLASVAAVVGLGLFCTAIAYLVFFRILASSGATNIALVTLLIPVSACLLGVLVLGERLATQHLAGMLLIGAGLAAIDGRPFAVLRRQWR